MSEFLRRKTARDHEGIGEGGDEGSTSRSACCKRREENWMAHLVSDGRVEFARMRGLQKEMTVIKLYQRCIYVHMHIIRVWN